MGCLWSGALAAVACAGLALIVAACVAGRTSIGNWRRSREAVVADPTVPTSFEGAPLHSVHLLLPTIQSEPIIVTADDLPGLLVEGSILSADASAYRLRLGEEAVNVLVVRFAETIETEGRYDNVSVDLHQGGVTLHADVDLGIGRQRMALELVQDGLALLPARVVVSGISLGIPDDGPIGSAVRQLSDYTERTLAAMRVVGPLPGSIPVESVRFTEDSVEIVAQPLVAETASGDTGWRGLESGVEIREVYVPAGSVVERLILVRLNPSEFLFGVRYAPDGPAAVSEWAERDRTEHNTLLVVNGTYFDENYRSLALVISDRIAAGTALGDFAGMFAVDADEGVSVRWLRDRPYMASEELEHGIQSYPVLVKPGGQLGFPLEADSGAPARRTVVGQDVQGRILFVVATNGYLTLHQLAESLVTTGAFDLAVNLDGGGSTGLWLSAGAEEITVDSLTPVPSAIVVRRP
ncbi:MAG: phosphodiester glycosidase family protein [Chloroflexi bacterium]|nr:phosphodiester glycosidase family protein [Chloroflexota bacterium]